MLKWVKKEIDNWLEEYESVTTHGEYWPENEPDSKYCRIEIRRSNDGLEYNIQYDDILITPDKSKDIIENAAILVVGGTIVTKTHIYEDETGIYRSNDKLLKGRLILTDFENKYRENYYNAAKVMNVPKRLCNYDQFYSRISKKDTRMSLEAALDYLKHNPEEFILKEHHHEDIDINDPIISISAPDITRKFDNKNKDTFDFVAVEILLRSNLNINSIKDFITENKEYLNKRALESIADSKKYQKYDVPVSYLKPYGISTHSKTMMRIMYELKKV